MSTDTLPTIDLPQSGKSPMYKELRDHLAQMIHQGELKPGQKFYSYRNIATASGVSRITAQLAVKELIKDGLLKQQSPQSTIVCAPADAVLPQTATVQTLGIVLSQWDSEQDYSPTDSVLLNTMLQAAADHHVHLQIIPYTQAVNDADAFDQRVREGKLDGLIWLSMRIPASLAASRWMGREMPQVAILSRPVNLDMPLVTEDNYQAVYDGMNLLLDEGHKRFVVLHGDEQIQTYQTRLAGLRDACKQRGIDLPADCLIQSPEYPYPDWVEWVTHQALERIRPTAVLQLSNTTSTTVKAAAKLGMQPGRDFHIMGFTKPHPFGGPPQYEYRYFQPRLKDIASLAIETWLQCLSIHQAGQTDWHNITRTVPMDLTLNSPSAS
jgi:DNA-binding LacI/PurR family transcriptional regulator